MATHPETPYRIEPCMLERVPVGVLDQIAELTSAATALGTKMPPETASSLADLVRIMNCYYSNLIEGHHTRPRDIERALNNDLDGDDGRRNLQAEARAHVRVQKMIDDKALRAEPLAPASASFIRWVHQQFYKDAPEEMLLVGSGQRMFMMEPGAFRSRPEHDNLVGQHQPPSSPHVVAFMEYFASQYDFSTMRQGSKIIAFAAAHHRLNYIHPFPDGNGRVSRLMSHAMGLCADIGSHGLWSVSRGLARGLQDRTEYKTMMDATDEPRRGDLDGRGNLSRLRLEEFVTWFLSVCIDQVTFMQSLFQLDTLGDRLRRLVIAAPQLHDSGASILEEILRTGHMPRGRAPAVTGLKERAARSTVAGLLQRGIVTSQTPKSPLLLHFRADDSAELFPALFLDAALR